MSQSPVTIVNYHNVSDAAGPFDDHMNVRTSVDQFGSHLEYFRDHYNVISLDRLLSGDWPERSLLITLDDNYASAHDVALPMLLKFGFPAVQFVIGEAVLGRCVPLDNLMNYVTSVHGLEALKQRLGYSRSDARTLGDFIFLFLSRLPVEEHDTLRVRLVQAFDLDEAALIARQRVFLTPDDLLAMQDNGIEIGCHSWSHGFSRHYDDATARRYLAEPKYRLEALLRRPVRAFAYPYGSSKDHTPVTRRVLRAGGYEAIFLVEDKSNSIRSDADVWYRSGLDGMSVSQVKRQLLFAPLVVRMKHLVKSLVS